MGRAPCCEKMGLKKGQWTPEEDKILVSHIEKHGHGNWRALPKLAGLLRCGKSCRLRWINYLRPDIRRGNFTQDEEETILKLHEMLGNRWSAIAARLAGRTDNEIKNVWHTHLKKRLKNKSKLSNENTAPESVANGSADAPTSPQASSEVMSTSDLSTAMADGAYIDIKSEETDPFQVMIIDKNENTAPESVANGSTDAPMSPQASSEVMSTSDLSTATADAAYVEIKSDETDPFQVMIIDKSFWSGDLDCLLMMDDNILSNSSFSSDFIDVPGQSELNSEDDVGFWYDLLIRTGGVPEFSV